MSLQTYFYKQREAQLKNQKRHEQKLREDELAANNKSVSERSQIYQNLRRMQADYYQKRQIFW
ncbi:MAG TPA: hypothetical protein VIQ31_06000 [Phormidium sp.]